MHTRICITENLHTFSLYMIFQVRFIFLLFVYFQKMEALEETGTLEYDSPIGKYQLLISWPAEKSRDEDPTFFPMDPDPAQLKKIRI